MAHIAGRGVVDPAPTLAVVAIPYGRQFHIAGIDMKTPYLESTFVGGHWAHFRDTVLVHVTPPLDDEQLGLAEYVYRFAAHGTASFLDEIHQKAPPEDLRRVLDALVAESKEYFAKREPVTH
jgi:hypothetical protein